MYFVVWMYLWRFLPKYKNILLLILLKQIAECLSHNKAALHFFCFFGRTIPGHEWMLRTYLYFKLFLYLFPCLKNPLHAEECRTEVQIKKTHKSAGI